jgi:hypothetical protein
MQQGTDLVLPGKVKPIGDGTPFEAGRGATPWEFDSPTFRMKTVDDMEPDELRAMLRRVLAVRDRISNGWVSKDVDEAVIAELDAALTLD